jgi:hypothetical protein
MSPRPHTGQLRGCMHSGPSIHVQRRQRRTSVARFGKSFTPLNAARGPRAAHPVAALGRPIFYVFRPFLFLFFLLLCFCFLLLFIL